MKFQSCFQPMTQFLMVECDAKLSLWVNRKVKLARKLMIKVCKWDLYYIVVQTGGEKSESSLRLYALMRKQA